MKLSYLIAFSVGVGLVTFACQAAIVIKNETQIDLFRFSVGGNVQGKAEVLASVDQFRKGQSITIDRPEDGLLKIVFRIRPPKMWARFSIKNISQTAQVALVQEGSNIKLKLINA